MNGYYPDLLPDETFHSGCARYSDIMQYPGGKTVVEQLFGTKNVLAVVDLPGHLDSFIKLLPSNHYLTVDTIIDQHTLLPFYGPFLIPERVQQIRQAMAHGRTSSIHARAGIVAGRTSLPTWLKFCPCCAEEDKQTYGLYYWHRLPQVPGVEVCPSHKVFLQHSNVRMRDRGTLYRFISAEQSIQVMTPCPLQPGNTQHDVLLSIALDAQWLLSQTQLTLGHVALRQHYRQIVGERGFLSPNGRIHVNSVSNAFIKRYDAKLLAQLECQIDDKSKCTWLMRLLRTPDGALPPLCHLLLMHFLGCGVASFFLGSVGNTTKNFFGEGPWPCLNQVCSYYLQPHIIENPRIVSRGTERPPVGTFTCLFCGFSYARSGPDQTDEDRYRIGSVRTYGPVWENTLRILWHDPNLMLKNIAQRLGVHPQTVKSQAARLGLSTDATNKRVRNVYPRAFQQFHEKQTQFLEKRDYYREAWRKALADNPHASMTLLIKQYGRLYRWLKKHDTEWLAQHKPSRTVRVHPGSSVDWTNRDAVLVEKVIEFCQRITSQQTRPKRITVSTIAKGVGELTLLQKHLDKLPRVAQVLPQFTETLEDVAIRRVRWATELYLSELKHPTREQLIKRAYLDKKVVASSAVQYAIDLALNQFVGDI